MKVTVVGAGPGKTEVLTQQGSDAIETADVVLTSEHLVGLVSEIRDGYTILGVMDTLAYIKENHSKDITVCVVASGDTGFYSIASTVRRNAPEDVPVEFICGISSMQYFCALTGHSYEHMKLVSLHGRAGSIVPYVCYNKEVFALTGGDMKAGDVIAELAAFGLGGVRVWVGEKLSLPGEMIVSGTASELMDRTFGDLAVVILENPHPADPYQVLRDGDFIRGKAPMTKEGVRNLSLASLSVRPTDVVWDIGSGTGAMTCVLAQAARESFVYAIEKEPEAVSLAEQNMEKLGIRNIRLVQGEAPEGTSDFPAPDKVFIGGSSGNLREILTAVLDKNDRAQILVTAVTMETISEAFTLMKELGLQMDVTSVSVANASKLGRYHLMKAENPVYLIKGERTIES